jgi:RNA polymerase sigma factor (sigma-70 family)
VTTAPINRLVHDLARTLAADDLAAVPDAELLARFRDHRDPAAFEAVVRRHGPRVLGACRKVLADEADVEDAFQATFVILMRDPHAVRRANALGPWLFGVAHRVALQARIARKRRERIEARAAGPRDDSPDLSWKEACAVLHEELDRLPETHRLPLLLCYLDGLTRDEAARRLGRTLGSIKRSLEVGRERLRKRLKRRGIALSAGLLAAATEPTWAALAPRSVQTVVRTAGGDSISPAVAALARPAVGGSFRAAVGACLAASVVIACVALGQYAPPGQPVKQPPGVPAVPATEAPPRADEARPESVTYAGRVIDSDGNPVAGAKLFAVYYTPKVVPIPEGGTTDKDGKFKFTVPTKDFDGSASAQPWNEVVVYAVAPGYGLNLADFNQARPDYANLTLHLAKDDVPITGRITDLQGKPVAGASVTVRELWWPASGDLTNFVAALKRTKELYPTLHESRFFQTGGWMGRDVGRILPPTVTNADGKFRLAGIGREKVVGLRVEGPTIATADLWAMTRMGESIKVARFRRGEPEPELTFAAGSIEHIAAPGRPVVGTIRDKDTGKPIPGAVVESYLLAGTRILNPGFLRTVADKDGKFRLLGLPKAVGSSVRVRPPDGQPYLTVLARVPDAPGLEPATLDAQLKRGVWITGRVTDQATGKPVPARISYAVDGKDPNLPDFPGLAIDPDVTNNPADGKFRFAGLPGRGVVAAQALRPTGYRTRNGADRIKDLGQFVAPIGGGRGPFPLDYIHTIAEINPAKDAESVTCDLVLVAAAGRTGTVVGPDGKPLAGTLVCGLDPPGFWDDRPAADAKFTVRDIRPDEPRLVQFVHPGKGLAGSVVVRDEKGPLTVQLEPAATLTGRFVTPDGKPLAELEIIAITRGAVADPTQPSKPDVTLGSFPRAVRTDKDGNFRITGLAPGLKYRLGIRRGMFLLEPGGDLAAGVAVKAGETKDLGAVTIKTNEE